MGTETFEALAQGVATVASRRSSLLTLGGAALAAAASQSGIGEAKKKSGNKCKKKEKNRCNNDAAACIATAQATGTCDATCIAQITPCCETCSANDFLVCLLAASAP
jgi:hypothetical protein